VQLQDKIRTWWLSSFSVTESWRPPKNKKFP
jgi:hypothetical protein